jgi:hypothetical protein
MDITKHINWSDNLEKYFKDMGERSYAYSYLHKRGEQQVAYYRNFIDLPVIILSTIAGTLSIGGTSVWGKENESNGTLGVGVVSILVGVMNTVGSYFGFSKRAEAHRLTSIQYGKLYRFLSIELSLPRKERMNPADLLKVARDTYERLAEVAPLIPYKILEDFKIKFKNYDVAKPSEANGLEEIEVYSSSDEVVLTDENIDETINEIERNNELNS